MNPALLQLARQRVWADAREKMAVVGPGGGAPPMDPAMMGAAGGGAPPMDPAMAGGAPPMDPAMMGAAGGAPPMDPAMAAGGAPPAAPMPADPAAAAGMGAMPGAAPQKLKPEQMMQMLDFRLYNIQQGITAIMNAGNISLPPGVLVTPPGSPTPVAEAAVPGGPQDPGAVEPASGAGGGGGAGQSAIGSIDPIQGASPELAAGGGEKVGAYGASGMSSFMQELLGDTEKVAQVGTPFSFEMPTENTVTSNASAVAAMLRQRTSGAA